MRCRDGNGVSASHPLPSATSHRQTHGCCPFPKLGLSQPALPEHDLGSWLGVPHPWPPLHGSWERSSRAQNQPAWLPPHPGGATGTPPCCHPPASPALRHTRRGGSDGSKATTRPRVALGGQSKSHRAMNPPTARRAVPLPSVGTTLCRDPREVPRYHRVSRHRDTLQPRARASAGTDGTAWDTLSSTNTSPRSPCCRFPTGVPR